MGEYHLRIINVSKSFGPVEALKNVSIDIPRGSFTTFLGPSGCGKTTMLRIVAGFYELKEGEIYIGERLINRVPSHQRNAIMFFQDYALFPHMNIGENIAYGLRIEKIPDEEIKNRVEKTARYLGIQGLEKRNPGQISGGQQQRVALALSDQIAVMDKGGIIQSGTPWEIYYKPLNEFVADFVGTANLISGRVSESSEQYLLLDIDAAEIRIEEPNLSVDTGSTVTLCIRPETIEILKGRPEDKTNVLKGKIVNYIFEGAQIRYWVEIGQKKIVVDAFDPSEKGVYEGEVALHLHPKKMHILSGKE